MKLISAIDVARILYDDLKKVVETRKKTISDKPGKDACESETRFISFFAKELYKASGREKLTTSFLKEVAKIMTDSGNVFVTLRTDKDGHLYLYCLPLFAGIPGPPGAVNIEDTLPSIVVGGKVLSKEEAIAVRQAIVRTAGRSLDDYKGHLRDSIIKTRELSQKFLGRKMSWR